jgi:hypothetical protein
MNYNLHYKATDLMQMHQDMKAKIETQERNTEYYSQFPHLTERHLNRIDTCKRGLERIEQAYIKVLTEILAV